MKHPSIWTWICKKKFFVFFRSSRMNINPSHPFDFVYIIISCAMDVIQRKGDHKEFILEINPSSIGNPNPPNESASYLSDLRKKNDPLYNDSIDHINRFEPKKYPRRCPTYQRTYDNTDESGI